MVVFEKPKSLTDAELHYCPGCTHGIIHRLVAQAIDANAKQVAEYLAGNERVLQYFVGQVMKLSKGRANPGMVIGELKKQLSEKAQG